MKRAGRVLAVAALVSLVVLFGLALRNRPADPSFEGKLASEWSLKLLHSDYTVRDEAKAALKSLGESAVPQLRALLRRRNGPWEKPLVRLTGVLPFLDYRPIDANLCRVAASEMLGSIGASARTAVPDLISALAYNSSAPESERALLRIGPSSIPQLEKALWVKNDSIRTRAARLLREIPSASETTAVVLIAATDDRSPAVRKEAALSLGAILESAKFTGRIPEQSRARLVTLSRDDSAEVRAAAMCAMGRFNCAAPEIIAALTAGLNDHDPATALESAKSLWALDQPASGIVPVLIAILDTPERWRAAYALGEMGTNAAPAAPALARLLETERVPRPFRTPPSSAFALGKIGISAIPDVARLLENPEASVRMNALMAFGFMGKAGDAAIPQLLKVLSDKNAEVRHTAALTLASVGAEPNKIISGLSDCLKAEDIYMRSAAAAHLREIAPDQTWLIPGE